MPVILTAKQKEIIRKIIYAVETGGQVYGNVRYDDFTEAYTNSSIEYAITIGGGQWYATEAQRLLKLIRSTDKNKFLQLDVAGISSDLDTKDWSTYNIKKTSTKAKCIQKIINSDIGRKCQDRLIDEQMQVYIDEAFDMGVRDIDALMMCANFRHQGGLGAVKRILDKTSKPYTLDKLYASCQTDTGNQVGVYKTRQSKVYGWLKQYLNTDTEEGGNKPMDISKVIDAMIETAKNELGYLEKKSNSQLDSKTSNAGSANFTKYWRDLKPSYQGQPWCAVFVSWVFYMTFGLEIAKKLLKHITDFPYVYCPTLGSRFTKHANPQKGDIVIFYRNGTFAHTGIVTKVQGDKFWTIEGNTSGGSTIVENGGAVCEKSYYNSNLPGTKFCRPDYSIVTSINSPIQENPITKPLNKTSKWKGTVTADSLNVRKNAGTEYETCSFSPLEKGTEIDVCDELSNGWLYIKYNDKYGFVSGEYVKKKTGNTSSSSSSSNSEKIIVGEVTASVLNVRSYAGTEYPVIKSYPQLVKGNRIRVISSLKSNDGSTWYKIAINNAATKNKDIIGFVSAKYIKKV